MKNIDAEFDIVGLLNKAIKFRNDLDLVNFNNAIKEIDAISYERKFDLLDLLFDLDFKIDTFGTAQLEDLDLIVIEENFDDIEQEWTDRFIQNDIECSYDALKSLDLLETLMMIGKSRNDTFYKDIITSILHKIDPETDEIFYVRAILLKQDCFQDFIPDCFQLKEGERLPDLVQEGYSVPYYKFIESNEGEIVLRYHPANDPYLTDEEIEQYIKERIQENLKRIPKNDTLKEGFKNTKLFF